MNESTKKVRVRMAPSPTGNLHLGTAYATLFPYLFARKHDGVFILRVEDTDTSRSTQEFAENILNGLKWLGFEIDEGPYYQMQRLKLYQEKSDQLLSEGKAYYCFCTKEELNEERNKQAEAKQPLVYSGKCRDLKGDEVKKRIESNQPYVVRHKLPTDRGVIKYKDLIHGEIEFDSKLLGDMVIMRQNGIPLYNFAVVVDDIDMRISHVIRGDDHVSNTPKQILLFEAFEAGLPEFGHYPMVLNQDRVGKLSKRTGSTSVQSYKDEGYLPEAIINYLGLLGMTPPGDREVLSLEELISIFDIKYINPSAGAWNQEKLDWINGEHIRLLSDEDLTKRLQDFLVHIEDRQKIAQLVPLIKSRIKKLADFIPLTFFLFEEPEYDIQIFEKIKVVNQKQVLERISEVMGRLKKPWGAEEFERTFREMAQDLDIGVGELFQLIRVAFSGQLVTPPLFESMKIFGEEKSLQRIKTVAGKYPNF